MFLPDSKTVGSRSRRVQRPSGMVLGLAKEKHPREQSSTLARLAAQDVSIQISIHESSGSLSFKFLSIHLFVRYVSPPL